MRSIYLDHNSTTPLLTEVAAAMADCYAEGYANPASQHQAGRKARQRLEQARESIGSALGANFLGAAADRLILTSGGTEANNLALLGLASAAEAQKPGPHEAIISAIEHPSIVGPAEQLEHRGWKVHRLGVNQAGVVQVDQLPKLLNAHTRFISVMLGNNETGVLQPVQQLAAICQAAEVPLHTDAVQIIGKLPVNYRELGVTAMSIAAHKFHGPLGVGALLLRHDVVIAPQLHGGFQQSGMRPGTESVAMAVGMQAALEAFQQDATRAVRMQNLRDRLEAGLCECLPEIVINGQSAPRLPGTANLAFVGLDRQELLIALDLAGVACSTGSACASGSSEPSPVLLAMNLSPEIVASSLRFSLGATTTPADIDEALARIATVCQKIRGR